MTKLGLLAGGGDLPLAIARRCEAEARPFHILRMLDNADEGTQRFEHSDVPLGAFGQMIAILREHGCDAVCLAGNVGRPDFAALQADAYAQAALPAIVAAAAQGDDALLRAVLAIFEGEGFAVEGADAILAGDAMPAGALGRIAPSEAALADIGKALDIATATGALDIGQGAVVCDGLVLAVEAQEGTDAMLARVAELPTAVRGTAAARRGVLAKTPKPIQDRRVDMPVIGPRTIENAAAAGLAGVAGRIDSMILIDRPAIIEAADRLGLFVWGQAPA
jgi:DUF1009 family protein